MGELPKPLSQDALLRTVSLGFVERYVAWAGEQTDAPLIFHLAASLGLVAAAAGNRRYATAWGKRRHPNLFQLTVAASGMRKGAAQGLAGDILFRACPDAVLPNDFSRERLIEQLAERPAGLLRAGEMGELMGRLSRDYMGSAKELITDLWDGVESYSRDTKSGGKVTIVNPAPSLLTASTIDWLKPHLKREDATGGFLGRFLVWIGRTSNGRKGLVLGTDDEAGPSGDLVKHLHNISVIERPFDARPIVADVDAFVFAAEDEARAREYPPEMWSFVNRLATHALKLAMCFELARDPQALTLTRLSGQAAVATLNYLLHEIQCLLDDLTWTKDGDQLQRLKGLVGTNGGIDRSTLLRKSKLRVRDFDDFLQTLMQSGQIVQTKVPTAGRPLFRYQDADAARAHAAEEGKK